MALMNLNIDGVLTVEKVVVPADGITVLDHSLFRGEKIVVRYDGEELTRGQDFIPDRIDDRLYFQKNICLFTALKILNESLFGQEIEVEYFACGDYINAEIWNEYPSSASLKQSLASKVDNSDFTKEMKRIDDDVNAEVTARKEADNTLQDNINIEENLRIAEDENLQENINAEAGTRKTADDNLQEAINAEATDRQTADSAIRADLENETDLRLAGDAVLQEKIDAEMSTRAENDSNLQTQISDLKTKFESFVPGLTYKVVSVLPTVNILSDVIYLVPADSTGSQNVYNEYLYIGGNWELIGTTATTQAITVDSALSETSTNPVQNKVINEALKNSGKVYTSLTDLGLTAPVTVGEIFNAMPDKTMAMIACEEIEENTKGDVIYVSDVPMAFGILTIKKSNNGRFSIEYQISLRGATCNVKRWIGTLQGIDGTGLYWKENVDETRVTTLETQVSELFQSVSNGKTSVANAITDKGVPTSTTATFATMTANIGKIKSYKEETKSFPIPLSGSTTITSTFLADVIGIKQIILPKNTSRIIPQETGELFKIEGKNVTMTITGTGTWKITALIKA